MEPLVHQSLPNQLTSDQFFAVLESLELSVFVKNADSVLIHINSRCAEMWGTSAESLLGTQGEGFFPDDQIDGFIAKDRSIFASGATERFQEYFWSARHQSNRLGRTIKIPTFDESGKPSLLFCIIEDITDISNAQAALRASEQRFEALISNLQIGVLVQSEKDEILLCNSKSMELLGLTKDQLLGRSSMDPDWVVVDEDGSPLLPEDMPSMRAARTLKSVRNVILGVNRPLVGGRVWLQVQAEPVLHSDGNLSHVVVSFVDVSDLRNARHQAQKKQQELSDQSERLAAVLDHMADAVITIDTAGKIESFNQSAKKMFGYKSDEVITQDASMLLGGPDLSERNGFLHDFNDIERSYPVGQAKEVLGIRKNGSTFALNISATQTRSGDDTITVALLRDLTEQRLREEEIQTLAFYDPLTELPNRRMLTDRLKQALANTPRHNRIGALLFIDLDHFKTLNDTQGHFMGDLLLQQVAKRLRTCVREGDTVARLGGDEFVVMLENLSESETEAAVQAESVGEKIMATLGEPYLLENQNYNSTPSVGITLFDASTQSVDEPLKRADAAMYQAKAAGRNTFRFFNPDLQLAVSRLIELQERLARAVAQSEFVLYYQPQVMQSGCVSGVEVLLRWNDPERGMVLPAEFIPVAEETGLILPLGHWVLQSACQQLAKWAGQVATSQLTVAVNVSAKQLAQANFVTELLGVLEQTGANPALLKLEITESMLVHNIEEVIAKMAAIKALGVGFSIDDFGTGYSSLSYLKRLPLDQLKIDRGFVRDILEDPNDAAISNMVIALATSMKLSVIAEGVETLAQRDFLASQGCCVYQGYLFSKPVPVGAFEAWLHELPVQKA